MKNKGFVIFLTVVITALCLYYLSFTMISLTINKDALRYATGKDGVVNLDKKQFYLDSIWSVPVFNLFGLEYTYKEVKENELSMGLDLQGGMHVTLEISPVDIIKGLSGNNQDSSFVKALAEAREAQKSSQEKFSTLFFNTLKKNNPNVKLAEVFASTNTRGRISLTDSDEAVMDVVNEEIESAIDRSFTILRNRLDQFGTSSPNIQRLPGTGRIQVEIPGADNPQRVRKLLQGVARLEFWDVVDFSDLNNSFVAINDLLLKEQHTSKTNTASTEATESEDLSSLLSTDSTTSALERELQSATDSTLKSLDSLQNSAVSPLFALSKPSAYGLRYDVKDTAEINRILNRADVKSLLPKTVGVYWANKPEADQTGVKALELYFLDIGRNGKPKLTGEAITSARNDLDDKTRPAVSMTMNATGTRAWAKMTLDASNKTPKGRIAIVLDNTVYSAPSVQIEISQGNSQISGNFTTEEAKDLANVLKAGSLPAPTKIVEEAIVGPTLGQVAQSQGFISMACGLALVVVFMVAYYSKGGFVANIALLFNIFFVLGILAQPSIGAALTLPGIAGIILTMGMAIDANVLIYERIKEEMIAGRKLRDAIATGYKKSFAPILDSNLTTFLTGLFLFLFGQGPIKGFATTLMIGIATSFFSAVYVSRVVTEWMTRKGDDSKISFETPISRIIKERKHFEFVKNSRLAYMISGSIIILGFVLLLVKPLNMGVDFKGGRSYVVSFNDPVQATDLKIELSKDFEEASTEVKTYGSNNRMKVTTSYLIDDDSDDADAKAKAVLIAGLERFSGLKYTDNDYGVDKDHFTIGSSSKVGATVADDIKSSAWKASLASLLAIFVYILVRFRKWQYSAGAIIALVHDTLFVVSAFAIANVFGIAFEIDQVFVAALLTIIGYSINDTVIIFDRIREYIGMGTSHEPKKIFNDAINDTLSRTFITSGTTFIVVLVLLIFGGEVLRGFSFALSVGIVVGTYSSIFIASPVVLDLDKPKEVK